TYSHGKGAIAANVEAAAAKGLLAVGIADHGVGHSFFGMKDEKVPEMRREIERLRALYPGLTILLGTEANVANRDGSIDLPRAVPLDYVVAGYHFGAFGNEPARTFLLGLANRPLPAHGNGFARIRKANTDRVLAALYANKIHVLSHPGAKAPVDLMAVGEACKERGTLMELNAKHLSLNAAEVRKLHELGVTFCIGSDAHTPAEIGRLEGPLRIATEAGLKPEEIVNVIPADAKPSKGDLPEWMSLS
ncbi:MAG: hypothetical protein IKX91_00685, partial [Firmicutes bacterium]|nr:hypothetical protein [Bacillota bacterium]